MHSFNTANKNTLSFLVGALILVLAFQNCAQAKFDSVDAGSTALKSNEAGDDASLSIPLPGGGDDINAPMPTPKPSSTPNNSQTTTVITTGGGGSCPAFGNTGSSVSINVGTGNNTQSNNISMKAAEVSRLVVSKCASIDMADVKILLEQLVVKQDKSEIIVASLKGQYLTRENSISFIAASSVSDVERVVLILQRSGHQFMSSKAEVKSMALKDSGKKKLSVALAQKTSFEKGRTYVLRLKVTESSSLVEDGAQCLLKPVLEVE